MLGNWPTCINFTLRQEGGFSQETDDPGNWTGGALNSGFCLGTISGISAPVLAARHPDLDQAALLHLIHNLPLLEVWDIYKTEYWNAIQGDQLPAGLDLALFDSAVNNGVGEATRLLQAQIGVKTDGILGPHTLAAIEASRDTPAVLLALTIRQANLYLQSANWPVFGLGWSRRLAARLSAALSLT